MADVRITDDQLLKQIHLTKQQLQDLLKKYNDFFNSLDQAQRHAFKRGEKSLHSGAKTLRDVRPERLEEFLKANAPPNGAICILGNENGWDE